MTLITQIVFTTLSRRQHIGAAADGERVAILHVIQLTAQAVDCKIKEREKPFAVE